MAQNAATTTSQFAGFLKPELAQPYFEEARRSSVFQSLARQVPLGASGVEIPVTTSKAKASWVNEAGKKPTSESGIGLKTMTSKKIAAITVVSAEVVRANPSGYIETYKADVAESIGQAFDAAAFHGTDTPFDWYIAETTKEVALGTNDKADGGVYADLVDGVKAVVSTKDGDRRRKLNAFAFDTLAEPVFLGSTDSAGRPLFVNPVYESSVLTSGNVIGRRAGMADGIADDAETIYGFGGDFSRALWGVVGGITYDVSTQASVTLNGELVSLWENNLVAIRTEAEFGLLINDPEDFVKFLAPVDGGLGE